MTATLGGVLGEEGVTLIVAVGVAGTAGKSYTSIALARLTGVATAVVAEPATIAAIPAFTSAVVMLATLEPATIAAIPAFTSAVVIPSTEEGKVLLLTIASSLISVRTAAGTRVAPASTAAFVCFNEEFFAIRDSSAIVWARAVSAFAGPISKDWRSSVN